MAFVCKETAVLVVQITGVVVEWTSLLVCLPIYTKGGKVLSIDVCLT